MRYDDRVERVPVVNRSQGEPTEQNGARELCITRNFQIKAVRHNPVTVTVGVRL